MLVLFLLLVLWYPSRTTDGVRVYQNTYIGLLAYAEYSKVTLLSSGQNAPPTVQFRIDWCSLGITLVASVPIGALLLRSLLGKK